jgi:putative tryptophan/tyrosine transport system substrate-binding protein
MKRRDFIAVLCGAAALPLSASAQQSSGQRRIGVLVPAASDDSEFQARLTAFLQGLQQLGWEVGRNVRIDIRWGAGDADVMRKYAEELVALAPDVIMAFGSPAVAPLRQVTRAVPIVFAVVADPVGGGYVESLAQPGGNVTGFASTDYGPSGKWLELLKEIAPRVTRAAVLRDPTTASGPGQFGAIQSVAPSLRMEVRPLDVRDGDEIKRAITRFAKSANGGLIVTGSVSATIHHKLIIALAAQHKLPAVYNSRFYAADGGLISYGPDYLDLCRRAAGYVDRVLKGERPADLPVQVPSKYQLIINTRTANALGLEIPPSLLARADELIE